MDSFTSLKRRLDSDDADLSSVSSASTPELVFSKRFRFDVQQLDDSKDSAVSSPDDRSDLFDIFTPSTQASLDSFGLDGEFSSPVGSTVESASSLLSLPETTESSVLNSFLPFESSFQDDSLFSDRDDYNEASRLPSSAKHSTFALFPPAPLPTTTTSTATSVSTSRGNNVSSPARSKLINMSGPVLGQWSNDRPNNSAIIASTHTRTPNPAVGSARLPKNSTHVPIQDSTSASFEALLEQYLDVTNVVENPVDDSVKLWIDRYATIPICGYLNRPIADRALEPPSTQQVALQSRPVKSFNRRMAGPTSTPSATVSASSVISTQRPSSLTRRATAPASVYGLKRRSFAMGKGREMVGLGVVVGDLLL
ncbi:uncharacterized protein V1516DRAFT_55940 [Lipomyces oligophaga]|uniref:uncharacterized protein n=1 Tax=Lipomyces oligophaga TaxID=45792 RepID=UPI0034CDED02